MKSLSYRTILSLAAVGSLASGAAYAGHHGEDLTFEKLQAMAERAFPVMDTDRDGSISAEELEAALPADGPNKGEGAGGERAKGAGIVGLNTLATPATKDEMIAHVLAAAEEIDTDDDGVISNAERRQSYVENNSSY